MNKHYILAGLLSLALISPTFAEENTTMENVEKAQNIVQMQKDFPVQRSPQGDFYGNQKKQAGNAINVTRNNLVAEKYQNPIAKQHHYTKVPLKKGHYNSPVPYRFDNRLGQRPPKNLYDRFPNSPFVSRPSSRFDSRFSMQPEYQHVNRPQGLRRNGYFQYNNHYNNMNRANLRKPQPRYHS